MRPGIAAEGGFRKIKDFLGRDRKERGKRPEITFSYAICGSILRVKQNFFPLYSIYQVFIQGPQGSA